MLQPSHQLTFGEHIGEFRSGLLKVASVLTIGCAAAYVFNNQIIDFIIKPLDQSLYFSSPSGGFIFVMQVCLAVGIIATIPVLIYQLAKFTAPAIEKKKLESVHLIKLTVSTTILALSGAAFAYYVLVPQSLDFFFGYSTGSVQPLISAGEYLNYVLGMGVTFALLFQIPILLTFINSINRFPPGTLRKYRRHIIVASLAFALVLPFTYDPISQFAVAVPAIVLYELSIIILWLTNKRHYKTIAAANIQNSSYLEHSGLVTDTPTLSNAQVKPARSVQNRVILIDGGIGVRPKYRMQQ